MAMPNISPATIAKGIATKRLSLKKKNSIGINAIHKMIIRITRHPVAKSFDSIMLTPSFLPFFQQSR
jgi:hypothetical protein